MTINFVLFSVDLYSNISLLKNKNVYLVEDKHFFNRSLKKDGDMKFNILKPVYHRATMKCYYDYLLSKNINCYYVECKDDWVKKLKNNKTHFYDPVDKTIMAKIKNNFKDYTIIDTPRFILNRKDIDEYDGVIRQTSFYIWVRKRYDILMVSNKPYGGKMTFDKDNRKKPYNGIEEDVNDFNADFTDNKYVIDAFDYVKNNFKLNCFRIANDLTLKFPIDRKETLKRLKLFVDKNLDNFGMYQDVMITSDNSFIFHSGLSVMINVGLITPLEIVEYILDKFDKYSAEEKKKNINNVEGFIRQILGWREFTRFMYDKKSNFYLNKNYFNANSKLNSKWYTAKVGVEPIDNCISKAFKFGYLHHIERLMLVSNYMVLTGISPKEMFKWFTEFSLDSYDWVMEYNVYCMASYSDGGQYVSKPYISSSNYILNMSTYPKGDWCDKWDFLFWSFMKKHSDKIKKIARLSPLLKYISKHI